MIIPRPNNLIIKPFFDPDVSPGGIIMPETSKERSDQGIVKYVGEDVRFVKIGDYVLFSGYSGTLIRLDGEGLLITMHEQLVVAVIGNKNWSITPVDSLYYKTKDGEYFNATYESAVDRLYETRLDFSTRLRFGGWGKANIKKADYRPSPQELVTDARWTESEEEIEDSK